MPDSPFFNVFLCYNKGFPITPTNTMNLKPAATAILHEPYNRQRFFLIICFYFFFPSFGTQNFTFYLILKRHQLPPFPGFHIFLPLLQMCHLVCLCPDPYWWPLLRWPSPYLKKPKNQTSHYQEELLFWLFALLYLSYFTIKTCCPWTQVDCKVSYNSRAGLPKVGPAGQNWPAIRLN